MFCYQTDGPITRVGGVGGGGLTGTYSVYDKRDFTVYIVRELKFSQEALLFLNIYHAKPPIQLTLRSSEFCFLTSAKQIKLILFVET